MEEQLLISILEKTSKERRKGIASKKDVIYANKLIQSLEDPDEILACLNNVNIHGGFKPIILTQLKKVNPNFFKSN